MKELFIFIQEIFDYYANFTLSDVIIQDMEDVLHHFVKSHFKDISTQKYFYLSYNHNKDKKIRNVCDVNITIDPEFKNQLMEFYPEKFI